MNYYECLGVPRTASMEEIRKVYKQRAKECHPDVNHGDPHAAERFKEVKEAYDTLYTPSLRKIYDAKLYGKEEQSFADTNNNQPNREQRSSSQAFDPSAINETFERFFGFDPKTKKGNLNRSGKKKNPLDTTDMFNNFFGRK